MIDLSNNLVAALAILNNENPWLELWELQVNDTECFRFVDNPEALTFEGKTYYPFPISRGEKREGTGGFIQTLTVSASAVDRALIEYLESGEIENRLVTLTMVNAAALASGDCIVDQYRVQTVQVTDTIVTLDLGHENLLETQFPTTRFLRTRCNKRYGSAECGYDITRTGALSTCDFTLSGSNGCTAHGDDEVAAGLARLHPLLYGGFPGILKGPSA